MVETSIVNIFLSKTEEEKKKLFNKAYANYINKKEKEEKQLKKADTSAKI